MSSLLLLGALGASGFLCQWLAWRTKLPAILFLLVLGIVAGPVSGILNPDALFGDLLFPFVSLAVAVILFEGSLTLKRKELAEIGPVVRNMVTYGALVNGLITTLAAHYIAGLDWSLSAIFGAIMVVTGPTVIVPLIRAIRPNVRISRTLRWEGIIIDPIGAIFAVLVFEWISVQQGNADLSQVIFAFIQTIVSGSLIGIAVAYLFGALLRRHWIPEYLHNFAAISFVGAAFVISDALMHESGLLAVTIMGIWLANMKGVHTRSILEFKESLTVIFVSVLFILLAARIDFEDLRHLGWGAIGVLLIMQFVARPIKVFLCTIGSNLSTQERLLLAWVGPRGIVAAAVSALFALHLEHIGYANAELIVPLSFSVIVGTVVIQSLTAGPLAKWLGVSQPESSGFLIIGANPVAVKIGQALDKAGAEVLLCDNYWNNIKTARMSGLKTYYGNPISDHAEDFLDIAELGGMLGLSHHYERNISAALRYREEFGIRKIFTLSDPDAAKEYTKHQASDIYRGRLLFEENTTYSKLASMVSQDAQIRCTTISETFSFSDWNEHYGKHQAIILFAKDTLGRIVWLTQDEKFTPKPGWNIFSLTSDSVNEEKNESKKNKKNGEEGADVEK